MQKKVDSAVELAARTVQSEPWDISHWWKGLVFAAVRVKHECCFRGWSEPYPGTVGDRRDFICGECRQRGPIKRVPDDIFGAEGTRGAFDLVLCPLDPSCKGARLKPVSCASVFADAANEFCDSLEKVLLPNRRGTISWQKAQEAYWAFTHFTKHLPDWDPTGAYDGAFERWEAECVGAKFPAWGSEGPPELVPLTDRIRQERDEALTGAQRAYEKVMVPARRAFAQAMAEAKRVQAEARMRFYRKQNEEIHRLLSGPRKMNRKLVTETWAAMWAAQEKSNREYGEKYPSPSSQSSRPRHASDPPGQSAPEAATTPPPLSEETAAYIHLTAAIQRAYEKAEAAAHRVYEKAAARAERAYQKLAATPKPSRNGTANEEAAWGALTQLAYRLTELGERVDQAIGRFRTLDVTEPKDTTAGMKREVRRNLGLAAKKAPPPPHGPREENRPRYERVMKLAAEGKLSIKQIAHATGANYHTARRWILKSRRLVD